MGWPSTGESFWPTSRARASELPPGANGTTKVIGLVGQRPCEAAGRTRLASIANTQAMLHILLVCMVVSSPDSSCVETSGIGRCRSLAEASESGIVDLRLGNAVRSFQE